MISSVFQLYVPQALNQGSQCSWSSSSATFVPEALRIRTWWQNLGECHLFWLSGSTKRQKVENGAPHQAADLRETCSEALDALLETVRQKGSYLPIEDVKGVQKSFLCRIAGSVMSSSESAGTCKRMFYFQKIRKASALQKSLISKYRRMQSCVQLQVNAGAKRRVNWCFVMTEDRNKNLVIQSHKKMLLAAGGCDAALRIAGALLRLEHRSLEMHMHDLWPLIIKSFKQGKGSHSSFFPHSKTGYTAKIAPEKQPLMIESRVWSFT